MDLPRRYWSDRLPRSRRALAILIGDLGLLGVVFWWGLSVHAVEPLSMPEYAIRTVLPFVLGWLVAAVAIGAYTSESLSSVKRGLPRVLLAWTVAVGIGGLVRMSSFHPGRAPAIFLAVVLGAGLLALLPWRSVGWLWARR